VLSSIPASVFSDEQLSWIEQWMERRGGGLCMVGGPNSFASGGWHQSALAKLLPVRMSERAHWGAYQQVNARPKLEDPLHPILQLLDDRRRNHELLQHFPSIRGGHAGLVPKPNIAAVLASFGDEDASTSENASSAGEASFAAITVGSYGKGRSLATAFPLLGPGAEQFLAWGVDGNQYYKRFWRNAIYWLTENAFVGRSRVTAVADKRFYKPGEKISLTAAAYDEGANPATDYRIVAMVEPQSLDVTSDQAPIRWPADLERTGGESGPLILWGEEFEFPLKQPKDSAATYALELKLADAHAVTRSNGGIRLELTAYEGDTQIDSTSLPLQVLHDPFEQQNPFPDHDLLKKLASASGGRILSAAEQLTALLRSAPTTSAPSEVRRSPAWSNWWLLTVLVAILTIEWCWRRRIGLA
jgi:hypothetical protein